MCLNEYIFIDKFCFKSGQKLKKEKEKESVQKKLCIYKINKKKVKFMIKNYTPVGINYCLKKNCHFKTNQL